MSEVKPKFTATPKQKTKTIQVDVGEVYRHHNIAHAVATLY